MKMIRTGAVEHSALGLGTAEFGASIAEKDAFEMMDLFLENGGTLIDTAEVYADWAEGAEKSCSEKCIGRYLRKVKPVGAVISTKGAHPAQANPGVSRVRPEMILADCEKSLENLGVDCIDVYFLHRDDADFPVGELMDALFALQDKGWVKAIGASNWGLARQMAAAEYAARRDRHGFDAVQQRYAYLDKVYESDPTLCAFDEKNDGPFCLEKGMSAFAFSAQMKGYIDKYENGRLDDKMRKFYDSPENRLRIERAQKVAKQLGVPAQDVATAYLLHRPWPVCALAGCRNTAQLKKSFDAAAIVLTPAQAAYLDGSADELR